MAFPVIMPVCPGCGAPVSHEGLYCRDCIIASRRDALAEDMDLDDPFDSLDRKAVRQEPEPMVEAPSSLVEETLVESLRKTVIKYSASDEEYQQAIASDDLEKLYRLGPEATPVLEEIKTALRDDQSGFRRELAQRASDLTSRHG